jgi:hypothetical protein
MKVARPIADFVQAVELMRTQHYIYAYAFFPFFFQLTAHEPKCQMTCNSAGKNFGRKQGSFNEKNTYRRHWWNKQPLCLFSA